MNDLGIAIYPGAIGSHTDAEIRENIEKVVLDRVIEALTKPVKRPAVSSVPKRAKGIAFKGSLEEVNDFFLEKGWTDRLPIIPPTTEKVEEFLKYTDRSPDEEIAILPQANLRATPRNIAVNAVMAGCRPEYMPLLIAAVEAIGEPAYALINLGSTGGQVPWLLVNGPIIKQLGIEYGVGLVSRGPNPVIGRAFRLIVSNIAGFRPGETWMGTWGYFQPFVFAEDEDACKEIGWKPYHVAHGFKRDVSTVTVMTTGQWGQTGAQGAKIEPLLEAICFAVGGRSTRGIGPQSTISVVITPPTAKLLAGAGYTKERILDYIRENIRVRKGDISFANPTTAPGFAARHPEGLAKLPKQYDKLGPDEMISAFAGAGPDVLSVVLCGDAWRDKVMVLRSGYNRPSTKEIKLPAAWEKLLAKAKK